MFMTDCIPSKEDSPRSVADLEKEDSEAEIQLKLVGFAKASRDAILNMWWSFFGQACLTVNQRKEKFSS